ncbi:MAG: carbohydrate ABC transporter permease [Anaerolineae bacterium]
MAASVSAARTRTGRQEWRLTLKGLVFSSPWLLGFILFTAYPIGASFYYSLTRYDVLRPATFIGLENYIDLFTNDPLFGVVIKNTLYMVIVGVPIALVVAFLLAGLLNNRILARPLFRTIFFIPSIVPAVAVAMVWVWIYNTQWGMINSTLASWGLRAIPFLSDPALAKPSLIIINCWAQGGSIVIFLAALQDVPRSLYEAALVDGASAVRRFLHITVPMCTPAILFVLITDLIGTFQAFTLPWLLTEGGPNSATELYGLYLYRNAFRFFKMGYASALAWILFIVIVVFTFIVFRSSARWVYYGGQVD